MVTNDSSLGEDLSSLGSWVGDKTHAVGQAVGLVDEDLIPGDAPATGEVAEHLAKLGSAFERSGQGFKAIDTGSWHGQAAEAAGDYLSTAPSKWLVAADAFDDAGKAVADYQRVLTEMQAKAARAKEDVERAEKASEAAREAHNAEVDAFNASDRTGPRPGEFHDPAAEDRAAAQQTIADAKKAVEEAGDRAARAVREASQGAPAEPGFMSKLKERVVDSAQVHGSILGDFAGGAVGAMHELGQLARLVMPFDPYKITHPAESSEAMATVAMGVVGAVADPYGAVKTTVDVDGWRNNPARTMGSMVPDALMSLAGGAGVAGKVARSAGKLAKGGDELTETGGKLAADAPTPKAPESAAPKTDAFGEANPGANPWEVHKPAGWDDLGNQPDRADPNGMAGEDSPRPSEMNSGGPPQQTEQPPVGHDPMSPTSRPESFDGPRSWMDDGSGRGPNWDDYDDGGPLGERSNGPESTPHGPDDEAPGQHGGPRDGADGQEPSGEPDARRDIDPEPDAQRQDPEHDQAPQQPAEPDAPGESRHELADEDRQTYRERIENRTGGAPWEESVARLRDEHPELGHLDDEKAMSVRRYIGEDASALNHTLREGDAIDQKYMHPEANVLRSALDDMSRVDTAETPEAFRDMAVSDEALVDVMERYRPGATVEEPGFTSASKEQPPEYFAEHGPDKPNKVRFVIEEPQHARDLEPSNPAEREVLWQDGNRFLVEDLQEVGDEIHIHMRDLGQER